MSEDQIPQSEAAEDVAASSEVEEAIQDAQATLDEVKEVVADATVEGVDAAPSRLEAVVEEGQAPVDEPAPAFEIDLLGDVDMQVMIELGRTQMLVEDVLKLGHDSVVELDKLAGDPVDVYVNRRLVARGEVLVLNDNFCVRIGEIVADLEQQATDATQSEEPAV